MFDLYSNKGHQILQAVKTIIYPARILEWVSISVREWVSISIVNDGTYSTDPPSPSTVQLLWLLSLYGPYKEENTAPLGDPSSSHHAPGLWRAVESFSGPVSARLFKKS